MCGHPVCEVTTSTPYTPNTPIHMCSFIHTFPLSQINSDFCKQLVAEGNYSDVEMSDPSLSSAAEEEEEEEDNPDKPFTSATSTIASTRHPFSVRDSKPILMNIRVSYVCLSVYLCLSVSVCLSQSVYLSICLCLLMHVCWYKWLSSTTDFTSCPVILVMKYLFQNAPMLPTKTNAERLAGQAKLREQFPVSSGSQHRTKGMYCHGILFYSKWI